MAGISIIIPTYNRRHLIGSAIESCLREDNLELEIIVVDDGSTDGTDAIVSTYASSVVFHRLDKNAGAQYARNVGMSLAKGDFIKFLDSDDQLESGSLVEELALATSQDADIVVSSWGRIDTEGKRQISAAPKFGSGDSIVDNVLTGFGVHTSAALYRLEYLRLHSVQWSPQIVKLDDWYFFTQAALNLGKIVTRNGLSYWFIAHDGPRLTDANLIENAIAHHKVLASIEEKITSMGKLTQARKTKLALYYFKELQVMSRYSKKHFELGLKAIKRLDPKVSPLDGIENKVLATIATVLGMKHTLTIYGSIRNLFDKLYLFIRTTR